MEGLFYSSFPFLGGGNQSLPLARWCSYISYFFGCHDRKRMSSAQIKRVDVLIGPSKGVAFCIGTNSNEYEQIRLCWYFATNCIAALLKIFRPLPFTKRPRLVNGTKETTPLLPLIPLGQTASKQDTVLVTNSKQFHPTLVHRSYDSQLPNVCTLNFSS